MANFMHGAPGVQPIRESSNWSHARLPRKLKLARFDAGLAVAAVEGLLVQIKRRASNICDTRSRRCSNPPRLPSKAVENHVLERAIEVKSPSHCARPQFGPCCIACSQWRCQPDWVQSAIILCPPAADQTGFQMHQTPLAWPRALVFAGHPPRLYAFASFWKTSINGAYLMYANQ